MSLFFLYLLPFDPGCRNQELCRRTSMIYEPLFVFFSEFLHDMTLVAFL